MNKDMKTFAIIMAALLIGGASLALGALTAPQQQEQTQNQTQRQATVSQPSQSPTPTPTPQQTSADPREAAQTTVTTLLVAAYPKVSTDYTISSAKIDDSKQWFTAILTYKGSDTMNRDTLRVLAQKKDGEWVLRTTPPEIILSAKKYRDVPEAVLKSVNKPVSLPGTDTSPAINQAG